MKSDKVLKSNLSKKEGTKKFFFFLCVCVPVKDSFFRLILLLSGFVLLNSSDSRTTRRIFPFSPLIILVAICGSGTEKRTKQKEKNMSKGKLFRSQ